MKNISIYSIIVFCFSIASCKNNTQQSGTKKINLTDAATIVTEQDSSFLQNNVRDITPISKQTEKQEVAQVIKAVDSVKEQKQLAEQTPANVTGTSITGKHCVVTLSALLSQLPDSYSPTKATEASNMKMQITELANAAVQQRNFTKLAVKLDNETFMLEDLAEFGTPWKSLTAVNNVVVTDNLQAATFREEPTQKLVLAVDRALHKAGKDKKVLQQFQKLIEQNATYANGPFVVITTSTLLKITGTKNGKSVIENIKISLPQ